MPVPADRERGGTIAPYLALDEVHHKSGSATGTVLPRTYLLPPFQPKRAGESNVNDIVVKAPFQIIFRRFGHVIIPPRTYSVRRRLGHRQSSRSSRAFTTSASPSFMPRRMPLTT